MARAKTVLKRTITAELLTVSLVELCGLPKDIMQSIMDNANPKLAWVKMPSWVRGMTPYKELTRRLFDIRINKSEYDRLVSNGIISDYLYE